MVSLPALILVPISTIICFIGICLIMIILSYIKHKPEVNQSTFDIAALHMGWAHICVRFFAYITLCCSLILLDAPNWLVSMFEIIVYIGFSYSSITWIVANLVAYGFMFHFDDISLVTDSQMKKFCFGTSIVSTYIQIILDYIFPQYNTATYFIFGGEENEER
jgi:hypothetical protein